MWKTAPMLLLLSMIISGCGNAKWTSIFRTFDVHDSVTIDAKQRAVLKAPVVGQAARDRVVLVCAEPSPNALSAVSSSLAASGAFSGTQSNPKVEAAIAHAMQEAATQLRRGRTVQLLRDGLYRACEGYMNGALTLEDYRKLATKYADATVTLMAIEQITPGEQVPQVTIKAGPVNAKASEHVSGTSKELAETTGATVNGKHTAEAGSSVSTGTILDGSSLVPPTNGSVATPVPEYVAKTVTDLVSRYLQSASQNTCIDTFSISPQRSQYPEIPHAELQQFQTPQLRSQGTIEGSPIKSEYREEGRKWLEEERRQQELHRLDTLRQYCDKVFGLNSR